MSIESRLPLDAWQACYDCGWGHMTEFAWWRRSLIEALETMTVVELKRVLDAWNAAAPGARPVRRELWYRGSKWRRSVAFVDKVLGRGEPAFAPMLGGEVKIVRPHWMREVEGGAS